MHLQPRNRHEKKSFRYKEFFPCCSSAKTDYIFDCNNPNNDVSTVIADKRSKDNLLKNLYNAVNACTSYMKKVGDGKITYIIYVYRRTEL